MRQSNDPQRPRASDNPEYQKFAALLAAALLAILALALLSPLVIGQRTPAVLGLDRAPVRAVDEAPTAEPAGLVAPETLGEPQSAAAPEQAVLDASQDSPETGSEVLQHEVQAGETIFQVAELYGISVQDLAAANHLVNPLEVQAGTVLIIPRTP